MQWRRAAQIGMVPKLMRRSRSLWAASGVAAVVLVGTSTVPNVAVTIKSFGYLSDYPKLSSRLRPIWIVDEGPGAITKRPIQTESFDYAGGDITATTDTWAAGALAPGQAHTFIWHVTPVKSGDYTVNYSVAAGLNGKARAVLANGTTPTGHFTVDIAAAPRVSHVAADGALVSGPVVPTTAP
jgi:hypothetical protein